jgi:NADPH-dependent curcumin reductase CurA
MAPEAAPGRSVWSGVATSRRHWTGCWTALGLAGLLAQGELRPAISITDGLDRAPHALAGLYRRGTNHIGKSLVRIAED